MLKILNYEWWYCMMLKFGQLVIVVISDILQRLRFFKLRFHVLTERPRIPYAIKISFPKLQKSQSLLVVADKNVSASSVLLIKILAQMRITGHSGNFYHNLCPFRIKIHSIWHLLYHWKWLLSIPNCFQQFLRPLQVSKVIILHWIFMIRNKRTSRACLSFKKRSAIYGILVPLPYRLGWKVHF